MELEVIQNKIFEIRGFKVKIDFDLASLYNVENKRLKEAVRRNINRFPEDFMFELTEIEFNNLRTQIASSNRGGIRYMPFAFTEQGIAMLSSVLNSEKAIKINISIIRAFVTIRQFALNYTELQKRINEIEGQFPEIYNILNYLVEKDTNEIVTERNKIGYKK
ncbi:ORF6N domain-containing protein [Flavobacterium sp.]|uniref:ORF6N domain-containing protein n=1 Tax=Flavobacterium sp. TaxID=239 RepID=UPI0025DE195C|nr:ORF6N domain-containing protein [Flavobacterium sp.]